MQSQFCWIPDSKIYQNTKVQQKKKLIWERYDLSKMTHEFCQQIGFVKKQVQITSQSIQIDIQVFISEI
jgi:hypothetical protein